VSSGLFFKGSEALTKELILITESGEGFGFCYNVMERVTAWAGV